MDGRSVAQRDDEGLAHATPPIPLKGLGLVTHQNLTSDVSSPVDGKCAGHLRRNRPFLEQSIISVPGSSVHVFFLIFYFKLSI